MKNTLASIVSNKDVGARNRAISLITQCMKQHMSAEEVAHLATKVQAAMHGRHFDAGSAKERISQMYYVNSEGATIYAPFLTDEECLSVYNKHAFRIAGYNFYDFSVVLNDTIANFHNLLYDWWRNEEWQVMLAHFVAIAINWLNDDDTAFPGEKAWCELSRI